MQQLFSNSNCFFPVLYALAEISAIFLTGGDRYENYKIRIWNYKNGSIINLFHLENTSGAYVEIIDFGCRLTKLSCRTAMVIR